MQYALSLLTIVDYKIQMRVRGCMLNNITKIKSVDRKEMYLTVPLAI